MTKRSIATKATDSLPGTKPADSDSTAASIGRSHEAYRYERVTIGLLMGDMRFRKDAAVTGDLFPQFKLPTIDGRWICKADFVGKRPLLVVFGSISCPLTVSSIEPLKKLHQKFGRDIEFVTVNVREAHPGENIRQPMDWEQKQSYARELQARYEIPWDVIVDDIDGTLHRALDTKPNAAYVMGTDGKIVFRTLFAGDHLNLEQALISVVNGRPAPRSESQAMLKPMALAIGFIDSILKKAGPQAQRDMLGAGPPLIVAAKIANFFPFLSKSQRGGMALATIFLLLAALAADVTVLII